MSSPGKVIVPLWRCNLCGKKFSTLTETEQHKSETDHQASRIPVWEVKAMMMEKRLEPLAKAIAEKHNISYEDYMRHIRDRQKKSPPGVFTSSLIWEDAIKLKLVKPGQPMPEVE